MTTLRNVRTLTRYMAWANDKIYDAVAALARRRTDEAAPERLQEHRSHAEPRLRDRLDLPGASRGARARLHGAEHGGLAAADELRRKQCLLDDWYIAWSDRLTETELERKVHFTFVGGGEGVMTCAEIALHLANHTTYHCGYIAGIFFEVPAHPPTTDLTVFIRDVPLDLG
jgi:uncharacterized damage-inducible protein DinB